MSDTQSSPSSIFHYIVVVMIRAPGQGHMQLIQTSQGSKLCHLLRGNLRFHANASPSLPPITPSRTKCSKHQILTWIAYFCLSHLLNGALRCNTTLNACIASSLCMQSHWQTFMAAAHGCLHHAESSKTMQQQNFLSDTVTCTTGSSLQNGHDTVYMGHQ